MVQTVSARHWVSVGAAIYDEVLDSFLLIQRMDNGLWQLPGGVVELGERLSDCSGTRDTRGDGRECRRPTFRWDIREP